MHYAISVLLIAMTTFGTPVWAYEETIVSDGGSLVGTVTLDGKVPRPKGYNLITLPDQVYCGRISDGQGGDCSSPSTWVKPDSSVTWWCISKTSRKENPSLTCMRRALKPRIANSFPLRP